MRPLNGLPDSVDAIQINNGKKEYQNELKFTEIERENRILLEKISSIMNKTKRSSHPDSWNSARNNRSLNSTFRKKKIEEIELQNAKMLQRLQEKKPNYNADKMKQEWKKQKNVMKIMSHYPASTEKQKSPRNSLVGLQDKKRSSFKLEPIESHRIKVLNGISFLITIRLTAKSLVIQGDTK